MSSCYERLSSNSFTSWQIDGEKVETVTDFIFLGSEITADSDCSHKIRRNLFPGRKIMTNLDSILKSREITLLTEVCIVKAMAFSIIMYRCENWTTKKAERQTVVLEKTLRVPRTARRSNQSIPREINPEYSLEGLMLKLKCQYFGHLMQTDSFAKTLMMARIEGRRRRG